MSAPRTTVARVMLLRAVVSAAIEYVGDTAGDTDASGLDASERLSESLVALGRGAPSINGDAWSRLEHVERVVIDAAYRMVRGDDGASDDLYAAVTIAREVRR